MELVKKVDTIGDLVTLEKAGKMVGVTANAVWLWMRYNKVPGIQLGRTILVSQNDLVAYIPRRKQVDK